MNASTDWERLAASTVAVTVLTVAGGTSVLAVPIVLAIAAGGRYGAAALAWASTGVVLLTVAASMADLLRWRTTSYRLSAERLEVHQGVVVRRRRTLARERIRTVDLSAHPFLRVFGLARLSVGTGNKPRSWVSPEVRWALGDEHVIVLDPLPKEDAERLRSELLDRPSADPGQASEDLLAAGQPGWVHYGPLSVWTLVLAGTAVALTFQVADWFGAGGRPVAAALDLADRIGAWPALAVIVAGVVLLGAIARLALHAEAWWRYRLSRGSGSLGVRRGLLTTRTLTLDEARVRGAALVQPLGARLSGGARVDVLAIGLGADGITAVLPTTLLPVAPHTDARDVLRRVLPGLGTEHLDRLRPHPPEALARRLRRAAAASLVLVATAVLTQGLWWSSGWWAVGLTVVTLVGIVAAGRGHHPIIDIGDASAPVVLALYSLGACGPSLAALALPFFAMSGTWQSTLGPGEGLVHLITMVPMSMAYWYISERLRGGVPGAVLLHYVGNVSLALLPLTGLTSFGTYAVSWVLLAPLAYAATLRRQPPATAEPRHT